MNTQQSSSPSDGASNLNKVSSIFDWLDGKVDKMINARFIVIILIVICMFYFVIGALGGGSDDSNSENTLFANTSIIEILLWAIFIVIVLLNGFQYFLNTNIST